MTGDVSCDRSSLRVPSRWRRIFFSISNRSAVRALNVAPGRFSSTLAYLRMTPAHRVLGRVPLLEDEAFELLDHLRIFDQERVGS